MRKGFWHWRGRGRRREMGRRLPVPSTPSPTWRDPWEECLTLDSRGSGTTGDLGMGGVSGTRVTRSGRPEDEKGPSGCGQGRSPGDVTDETRDGPCGERTGRGRGGTRDVSPGVGVLDTPSGGSHRRVVELTQKSKHIHTHTTDTT